MSPTKRPSPSIDAAVVSDAIKSAFISPNVRDSNLEPANLVDVMDRMVRQIMWLGTGDAATPMGALEAHALEIKNAGESISGALLDISNSIRELAEAVREAKP